MGIITQIDLVKAQIAADILVGDPTDVAIHLPIAQQITDETDTFEGALYALGIASTAQTRALLEIELLVADQSGVPISNAQAAANVATVLGAM